MKRPHIARSAAVAMAVGCLLGCSKEISVNSNPVADNDSGTEVGNSPIKCPEADPPETGGAAMKLVAKADGTCFWIDEREVRRDEYQAFSGNPPEAARLAAGSACGWNTSFAIRDGCEPAERASDPGQPVTCVDWCDAASFCASLGKRLCRGKYVGAQASDPSTSEWFAACSGAGARAYPYGRDYDPQACHGSGSSLADGGGLSGANEPPTCSTPEGVLNMSGNVQEWTDACDNTKGENDTCRAFGGSYKDQGAALACDSSESPRRGDAYAYVGFRCCSDGPS